MASRRSLVVTLIIIGSGLFLPIPPGSAADLAALERMYKEANVLLNSDKFQEALELYNQILEQHTEGDNVWVMRAGAKWRLKDLSGARADLTQAMKLNPYNFEPYRVRAMMRFEAEDYDGCLADLTKAIALCKVWRDQQLHPDDADEADAAYATLFRMRGQANLVSGDKNAAIYDFSQALELQPDSVPALFNRGRGYEAIGEPDAAIADYSRVIELEPRHIDALNNRAWRRFHKFEWDAAIADGEKALAIEPKEVGTMLAVGYAQFGKGDYASAVKSLTAAADETWNSPVDSAYALFIRHFALLRLGTPDKRVATSWDGWGANVWTQALGKYLSGVIDESQLESLAEGEQDEEELSGRACEMHFYIGMMRLLSGDKTTAKLRFQAAVQANRQNFFEHCLAQAELKRLRGN